jgi:hypothetical protein
MKVMPQGFVARSTAGAVYEPVNKSKLAGDYQTQRHKGA